MKKITLLILALGFSSLVNSQEYSNWSLDFGLGIHRIGEPIDAGYSARVLGQGNIGARYMFNERFGIRLDLGYNSFEADSQSLPFSSSFFRTSVEGIVNLGNIYKFNTFTNKFNLLLHGGLGGSFLSFSEPTANLANPINISFLFSLFLIKFI